MNPSQQPQNPFQPAGPPQPGFPPVAPQQTPLQPGSDPFAQPGMAPPQPFAQPGQFNPGRPTQPTLPNPGMPGQPIAASTYGADYLDTIAPPPRGPKLFSGSFTWILIGMAILFMFGVGIISLFSGKSNTTTAQTLYDRYDYYLKAVPNYHRYIKSSKLSGTDSDFKIFITNAQRDLIEPMSTNGLILKNLDKTIRANQKAYIDAIIAKLEDARLNATLDRNYASEMAYQAQAMIVMYNTMAKSTSKSISDNAKKALPTVTSIQKAFADFKESN